MTQPISSTVSTFNLPPPSRDRPQLTRMITSVILPDPSTKDEITSWAVGGENPLVPGLSVVRLISVSGGVEIYSAAIGSRPGRLLRHFVQTSQVIITEEAFETVEAFVEELAAAEEEDPDEPDPEPGEPDPALAPAPPNGQSPS